MMCEIKESTFALWHKKHYIHAILENTGRVIAYERRK